MTLYIFFIQDGALEYNRDKYRSPKKLACVSNREACYYSALYALTALYCTCIYKRSSHFYQNTLSLHSCLSKADIFLNSRVDQLYASNEMNQLQHETRMTHFSTWFYWINRITHHSFILHFIHLILEAQLDYIYSFVITPDFQILV